MAVLELGKSKMPMEVDLEGARFVPGGAEVTVNAGTGRFLRAKATAVIGITANDDEMVTVEIKEIKALGKLPIESIVGPILDKGLDKATAFPGVERDRPEPAPCGSIQTCCSRARASPCVSPNPVAGPSRPRRTC